MMRLSRIARARWDFCCVLDQRRVGKMVADV
jgi:hypothetical protein